MTTVLVTEEAIYCDSLMTDGQGQVCHNNFLKIWNNDLIYIAGAGSISQLQRITRYLLLLDEELLSIFLKSDPALIEDMPVIKEPDIPIFQILLVDRRDGKLYSIEEKCLSPIEVQYPQGVGSGGDYAKFAYLGSGDALTAMEIAMEYDIASGGRVYRQSIDLWPQ